MFPAALEEGARLRTRPGAPGRQRSSFPLNNNAISLASAPLQTRLRFVLISRLERKTGAELCPAGSSPGQIHPGCSAQPPLGPALLRCAGEGPLLPRLLQPLEGPGRPLGLVEKGSGVWVRTDLGW